MLRQLLLSQRSLCWHLRSEERANNITKVHGRWNAFDAATPFRLRVNINPRMLRERNISDFITHYKVSQRLEEGSSGRTDVFEF